jgi:hypothetical protein
LLALDAADAGLVGLLELLAVEVELERLSKWNSLLLLVLLWLDVLNGASGEPGAKEDGVTVLD